VKVRLRVEVFLLARDDPYFLNLQFAFWPLPSRSQSAERSLLVEIVGFANLKITNDAPSPGTIYHKVREKSAPAGTLWKRYLLVDTKEHDAYEIDRKP